MLGLFAKSRQLHSFLWATSTDHQQHSMPPNWLVHHALEMWYLEVLKVCTDGKTRRINGILRGYPSLVADTRAVEATKAVNKLRRSTVGKPPTWISGKQGSLALLALV